MAPAVLQLELLCAPCPELSYGPDPDLLSVLFNVTLFFFGLLSLVYSALQPNRNPAPQQASNQSPQKQAKPLSAAPLRAFSDVPLRAARRRRRPRREPGQSAPRGSFILAPFSLPLRLHVRLVFSPRPTPRRGRRRERRGGALPPRRRPRPPRGRPARRARGHGELPRGDPPRPRRPGAPPRRQGQGERTAGLPSWGDPLLDWF